MTDVDLRTTFQRPKPLMAHKMAGNPELTDAQLSGQVWLAVLGLRHVGDDIKTNNHHHEPPE